MFEAIGSNGPDCAMAEWGVAMTYYHPLWAPPTAQELAGGAAAVSKARTLEADERERLYIEAIGALFEGAETVPHPERAVLYEEAMARLQRVSHR